MQGFAPKQCVPPRLRVLSLRTLLVLAALALAGRAAAADPLDAAAARFAEAFAANAAAMLREAALLDPATGREDAARARELRRRQEVLWDWAAARRPGQPAGPADRERELAWPQVMANRQFLALEPWERQRFLVRADAWLGEFRGHFAAALRAVVPPDPELEALLTARLAAVPRLQALAFPESQGRRTAAFYVPARQLVYINLEAFTASPEGFQDALEHELWHHLLPGAGPGRVSANLWWEALTEASSELWAAAFATACGKRDAGPREIAYPVPTALASLCLATDRRACLRHLGGLDSAAVCAERLAAQGPLGIRLGEALRQPLPAAAPLARLLGDWGWHEDDGSPLGLDRFYVAGQAAAPALDRAFAAEKPLFMAMLEGAATLHLQALAPALGPRERAVLGLPPALAENLGRVLSYVPEPRFPYGSRAD